MPTRFLFLPFAWLLLGCGQLPIGPQICDRPEKPEPTEYRQGICRGDTYMTADWEGDLLYYPKGAFYRIYHGLGSVPSEWDAYLSFDRYPHCGKNSYARAAGNQVELKEATSEYITVLNGTCADYYLLLTVRAGGGICPFPDADPNDEGCAPEADTAALESYEGEAL